MTVTENKKRLVIVGATGMIGGYALRYALDHPAALADSVWRCCQLELTFLDGSCTPFIYHLPRPSKSISC